MVIGIKDAFKLIGVSIIGCCAVFVCTLFLNYYLDIVEIKALITSTEMMQLYEANVLMAKVICIISGLSLSLTSIVMLVFYIKHYIDTHKKTLGILKAQGYSNIKIALHFWVFGLSSLIGSAIGYFVACFMMPLFYQVQSKDQILPEITMHIHWELFFFQVMLPMLIFALLAICYAYYKLRKPVYHLLIDACDTSIKSKKHRNDKGKDVAFIQDLKRHTMRSRKTLIFFILFASFCFSSMVQMSFQMDELASEMMGMITLIIGIILASTTLILAITTVIHANTKTIALMHSFGYSQKACCKALLSGYRWIAYAGFVIGTIYQYALIRMIIEMVFKDIKAAPTYTFDVSIMWITLAIFIFMYEIVMYVYREKIKHITLKTAMLA